MDIKIHVFPIGILFLNLLLKSSLSKILATVYFPVKLITSSKSFFDNHSEL